MAALKNPKSQDNAKLIGLTIVVTTFVLLGGALLVDRYMDSNIFSSFLNLEKTPQHFVHVDMIATSGEVSYTIDLKVGFFKKKTAKKCKKAIPRIKNDILMLDLGKDIKERNMAVIKEKISMAVCKHCPDAEGHIMFDKFWHQ